MNGHPAWFITGTDTEIGKTFVACALLHAFRRTGARAVAMKPIAAGCDEHGVNEDVERLLAASSFTPPRRLVNPYGFRAAIAPHIAAAEEGRRIELPVIAAAFAELRRLADVTLVEGVGGFYVPLDDATDTADLAARLDLPLILVVGMRLGCINHTLLTAQAIAARGLPLAGWVANRIDPAMSRFAENVAALRARLPAPLLGVVEHGTTPAEACLSLRLPSAPGG
ncbi:MAG: ATP-dependent dethiobiotin synthetase BioD 1 [Candidatus Accumulibacter sp. BA-94]|uniref:dethiobiotin synthase n=1 Tax=Accumulibacter sp. TaxID=2053492 RepID=UPI00044F697B|nr:dethiobiotin synthase [Accumulibacter sp.]EXI92049.1 MAG: ATP-dependent dethiobiotin synthetase BioD 1 [Candidatus Accumulibacter sp. BA-94]MBL8390926.1 dethiobiotin synthase [Accumulibacter sp.]HRD89049.1 dethiobiotin synthase [Accumulibacter sp.]